MEEIRTNLSKEDVLHNMLELVGYLVEQEEEVDEIEVKVKDLNILSSAISHWHKSLCNRQLLF